MVAIIGYAWQADMHCPTCTQKAYSNGVLQLDLERYYKLKKDHGCTCKCIHIEGYDEDEICDCDCDYCCGYADEIPPIKTDYYDLPVNLIDPEFNQVRPIFSTDELGDLTHCGDCGMELT